MLLPGAGGRERQRAGGRAGHRRSAAVLVLGPAPRRLFAARAPSPVAQVTSLSNLTHYKQSWTPSRAGLADVSYLQPDLQLRLPAVVRVLRGRHCAGVGERGGRSAGRRRAPVARARAVVSRAPLPFRRRRRLAPLPGTADPHPAGADTLLFQGSGLNVPCTYCTSIRRALLLVIILFTRSLMKDAHRSRSALVFHVCDVE